MPLGAAVATVTAPPASAGPEEEVREFMDKAMYHKFSIAKMPMIVVVVVVVVVQ